MNYFDNKSIALLAAPFIAVAALIYAASVVEIKPELRPSENELLQFSYASTNIVFKKDPVIATGFLKSPVGINTKKIGKNLKLGTTEASEIAKRRVIPKNLTFILINESRKMAIINNFMLKEGDTIADSQILKIEKGRVLINEEDIGERWLKMGE